LRLANHSSKKEELLREADEGPPGGSDVLDCELKGVWLPAGQAAEGGDV